MTFDPIYMNPVLFTLEALLAGLVLYAVGRSSWAARRARQGGVRANVTRGNPSMSVLLTVFGFLSTFYVPPVVFSELSPVEKTSLYLLNTAAVGYVTLRSAWGRNKILSIHERLRDE